jgi:hypothetical protein
MTPPSARRELPQLLVDEGQQFGGRAWLPGGVGIEQARDV